jgi:hypothetical protein
VREVIASVEIETRSKGLAVRLEVANGSFGSVRPTATAFDRSW